MRSSSSDRVGVRILRSMLGLLWFSAWFFVALPAGLIAASGIDWVPPSGASRVLGVLVVGIALAGVIAEALRFSVQGRGTPMPFDPPSRLVGAGPYRWVRNPMYILYVMVVLGEAIAYRSPWIAGYELLFVGLAHLFVVRHEEPGLRERFGSAYTEYCQRVPRWLPRRTLPLDVSSNDATTRNSRGTL